jgi:hypothetical protein
LIKILHRWSNLAWQVYWTYCTFLERLLYQSQSRFIVDWPIPFLFSSYPDIFGQASLSPTLFGYFWPVLNNFSRLFFTFLFSGLPIST